jgi:anti-sigma B factor antagonist
VTTSPMAPGNRSARHVVVTAPAELDVANAADFSDRLKAACESPGMVTVDMTATAFCDMAGARALLRAQQLASANGGELRLASRCSAVLLILRLTGLYQAGPVYTDVPQSLRTPRAEQCAGPEPRVPRQRRQ